MLDPANDLLPPPSSPTDSSISSSNLDTERCREISISTSAAQSSAVAGAGSRNCRKAKTKKTVAVAPVCTCWGSFKDSRGCLVGIFVSRFES
ncbi:hypothetical protein L484_010904 [Morus notabilis]|uniref:Uncharacterized protein n=1 Tax=Morus notabilis TaxID=981085 RepID=W9RM66_9ROSA|nr:hypothetical protein L484_010904 [Morus notabilis]